MYKRLPDKSLSSPNKLCSMMIQQPRLAQTTHLRTLLKVDVLTYVCQHILVRSLMKITFDSHYERDVLLGFIMT
jgi:hypothetical protein